MYYCFGDYDRVVIFEAPDDTTVLAGAIVAFAAPGHVTAIKTTRFFTVQEELIAPSIPQCE